MSAPILLTWNEPPTMHHHAAEPTLIADSGVAYLAYRASNNHMICVRFGEVVLYNFGPPTARNLKEHILFPLGLEALRFIEVEDSPCVRDLQLAHSDLRHWIVTFPEGTLEVVARIATVASSMPNATTPLGALLDVMQR